MAKKKDKKDKKDKKNKKDKVKRKGNGIGIKGRLLLIGLVLLSLAFLPTSILLFFGMLPSIVSFFVGARGLGARASTVAAMNLAGCIPFVLKLWSSSNDFDASIGILTDPQALMVMYTAAAFGYMIDWVVKGFVSSFLYQKGMGRMNAIRDRQKVLINQWGKGVAGELPVVDDKKK